jgi:hypothetical protein
VVSLTMFFSSDFNFMSHQKAILTVRRDKAESASGVYQD